METEREEGRGGRKKEGRRKRRRERGRQGVEGVRESKLVPSFCGFYAF